MNRWTPKHIETLKQNGKIRGYHMHQKEKGFSAGKNVVRGNSNRSKALDWLGWNLLFLANELAITMEKEYKFDKERKFRFDYCFPALRLAIEYNGIMSEKSRHTTIGGYSKDMDKMNLAQKEGWVVLCYTPLNYKNVINDVKRIYANRNHY